MAINAYKGGWRVQVYDRTTGRMRHVGVYRLKSEARAAEAGALMRGAVAGETVAMFAARWLTDYPRPKQSTNLHNAERIARFVEVHGRRRMADIDRRITSAWARDRKGDVPALRAMFNDALREDIIVRNPWSGAAPSPRRSRRALNPGWLTLEDVNAIAAAALEVHGAGDDDWGPVAAALILVAAYTGIRPGEAWGLSWEDVDARENRLYVRRAVDSKTGTLGTPKNHLERTIGLPEPAAAALEKIRDRHPVIVFPTNTGTRFTGPAWAYRWHPIRSAAGRPKMHTYELRHFCATRLIEAGLQPWQVAEQLGHRDGGALVTQVYMHPDLAPVLDAVVALDS